MFFDTLPISLDKRTYFLINFHLWQALSKEFIHILESIHAFVSHLVEFASILILYDSSQISLKILQRLSDWLQDIAIDFFAILTIRTALSILLLLLFLFIV